MRSGSFIIISKPAVTPATEAGGSAAVKINAEALCLIYSVTFDLEEIKPPMEPRLFENVPIYKSISSSTLK